MRMTIYLPDDLAAEVKERLGDSNISAICQAALRGELDRARAHAEAVAEGVFERIEVFDINSNGRDVAFQGRKIGHVDHQDQTAYLTPRGAIALYVGDEERLYVYRDYDHFAGEEEHPLNLIAEVAESLGQKYVRELDI